MTEISVIGYKKAGVKAAAIKRAAEETLSFISKKKASLSVVFVDETKIKGLNAAYRGRNEPTDVLSFGSNDKNEIGDVFISPISARLKAKARGLPYRDYVRFIVVHGILHLCGYSHGTPAAAKTMGRREKAIMKRLNVEL